MSSVLHWLLKVTVNRRLRIHNSQLTQPKNQKLIQQSNMVNHSMARANLNKSVWLVKNTTIASKLGCADKDL